MTFPGFRRPSALLLIVGTALLAGGSILGFLAGSAIRSPAQVLADTAPPSDSVLTEPISLKRVTRSVTFEGTVEPAFLQEISPPPTSGEDGLAVVTRLPRRGASLSAGAIAAEVSGRPVILLPGRLPAYRTISPGMSGADVVQLQSALIDVGLKILDKSGYYGSSTAAAVGQLYERNGYEPETVGEDEVASATDLLHAAQRTLEQLQSQKEKDKLSIKFATEDVEHAQQSLADVQAKAGVQAPVGEVVFVPELPAAVAELRASVGQVVDGALFTATSGPLVVRGTPADVDGRRVHLGQHADLLLSPSGETDGRVASQTKVTSSEDADADSTAGSTTFTINPDKTLPRRANGSAVRILVTVAQAPKRALTVPVSAVSTSADGKDTVTVVRSGESESIAVVPGFAGDGLVQVLPLEDGALAKGDLVVTGVGP